ncbi:NUDIX hydrolase [uncultured Roseivirga sp.]|uniref:NUDIX hydrolase n=1 Tax=uncultured Roseivirga sp. TaxID=543088 RepID=UPI0030D8AC67
MEFNLREKLLTEIKEYQSEYKEEQAFKPRFESLLSNYENCFERSLLMGHITASAWILNHKRDSILLLHHAKLNKWLQPGGHADGDENVRAVALKEAEEETGISDFVFASNQIFDLDIHTIPERKGVPEHEHYDVRFLLVAPERAVPQLNHESNDLKWIHFSNLKEKISHEPSLVRMYAKTKQFI